MRVLLADADDLLLDVVRSFLSAHGYEVRVANDGLACLALAREFAPAALVIDRDLLWGGTEGVLELMADELLLDKIAVILTVDAKLEAERCARANSPVACLEKPYRLGGLLTHLDKVKHAAPEPLTVVK